jgi:hypothetical protein
MAPKKLFVEVTTSVHQNEYLARHLLHEKGGSFGVKGISRDKKTGNIISKPTVHTPVELAADLAGQIIERLEDKSAKGYSPGTALIVNCVPNSLILDPEWDDAIERVTKPQLHLAFREVFMIEIVMSHSARSASPLSRASLRAIKAQFNNATAIVAATMMDWLRST